MLNYMPVAYFVYAFLLFSGGMMGYIKAHSIPSVIGSTIFALLAIAAGLIIRGNPSSPNHGLLIGIETAMLVIGLFVFRYIETGKAMPALPAIAMSVVVLGISLVVLTSLKRIPEASTPAATESSAEAAPAR